MSSGQSLNDADRHPWLLLLSEKIKSWKINGGVVLACSALKESYRKILASNTSKQIIWVYLDGSFELIKTRLKQRSNHFMPAELLQSQFDTLEIPKYAIQVDILLPIDELVSSIISKLQQ